MSADDRPAHQGQADRSRAEAARRRRLAEVFGDVLPDTTSDERDPEGGESQAASRDEWYRQQVPPHHG